jgi:hypothetical protein
MRDDIHRLAPVPPHWKRLIRVCSNDADWAEEGPPAAARVAVEDLKRGLDQSFLDGFARATRKPDLFTREAIERLCQRQLGPFSLRMAAHMKRAVQLGASSGEAITGGITSALREYIDAHLRNIDGYLARRFPRQRAEMMHRLLRSTKSIKFDALSASAASGAIPKQQRPIRHLDLDADLRSPE